MGNRHRYINCVEFRTVKVCRLKKEPKRSSPTSKAESTSCEQEGVRYRTACRGHHTASQCLATHGAPASARGEGVRAEICIVLPKRLELPRDRQQDRDIREVASGAGGQRRDEIRSHSPLSHYFVDTTMALHSLSRPRRTSRKATVATATTAAARNNEH